MGLVKLPGLGLGLLGHFRAVAQLLRPKAADPVPPTSPLSAASGWWADREEFLAFCICHSASFTTHSLFAPEFVAASINCEIPAGEYRLSVLGLELLRGTWKRIHSFGTVEVNSVTFLTTEYRHFILV